jgi:excisionase family DNA binding protein
MARRPIVHRPRNKQQPTVAPPAPPPVSARLTYRVKEVISLTGLSQSTVYELMDAGTLRSTKVRGVRLIFADSLHNVLALT